MRSLITIGCLLVAAAAVAAPVIENGDEPAHGRRVLQPQELWRIGGLEDEENLLGLVRRAVADREGNLYLLDTQLVQVLVYGPDGELLGTLGQEGDGPGEIRRPSDVVLLPDGTVGLVQGFPGRIVKVEKDGTPAGELHPGGDPTDGTMFSLMKIRASGPHLVMTGAHIRRTETHRTVERIVAAHDGDGRRGVVYHTSEDVRELGSFRRDEAGRFMPDSWVLGADGRVWFAPERNAYRIDVLAPDGTVQRTITRDYESYRRTEEEIELVRFWMTPWRGRNRNRIVVDVAPTQQDILQMHAADDGRLWVLSSHGAHPDEEGIHSVWDVFDADGRFHEQVALACEGTVLEDAIVFPGQGLVVVIKGSVSARMASRGQDTGDGDDDEAVPLEVICYRLAE
ncbi:MAG: hypothetical protein GY838_14115 [bacterium]|nr:hypothetical protein [bacterium]